MAHDLDIPCERSGYPAPPDLAERRAQMGTAIAGGLFATRQPAIETTLAGLRALRFAPPQPPRGTLLQLHGGGFRIGRPEFEGPLAEALCEACGLDAWIPQYRLSPEAPFPAGLNDALAALTALRTRAGDAPLVVLGDSAGAGLAASLGMLAAAGRAPRIDALVLLSPWLDLTVTAPSFTAHAADDPMFSTESATVARDLYLQGADPRHPLASPLFGPVEGFPPTLISVGTREVLFDDSHRLHTRLRAAGVPTTLVAVADMEHVAVVRDFAMPGAAETLEAIVTFLGDAVAASAPR